MHTMRPVVTADRARAFPFMLPLALLPAFIAASLPGLLAKLPPQASDTVEARAASSVITAGDTINGDRIADPHIVQRIERVAARVPAELLANHRRERHVWYLAQAFASDDDAAIYYGLFREPAAALAFGCALDDALIDRCELADVTATKAAGDDPDGVACTPMRLALGAPAYEPDRCQDEP